MALVNVWHLRKVAESSAKPCDICYKPTTGVLITPDQKVIAGPIRLIIRLKKHRTTFTYVKGMSKTVGLPLL